MTPVALSLMATAVILHQDQGERRPWDVLAGFWPEWRSAGRIDQAAGAYEMLRSIPAPTPLPDVGPWSPAGTLLRVDHEPLLERRPNTIG